MQKKKDFLFVVVVDKQFKHDSMELFFKVISKYILMIKMLIHSNAIQTQK